jgi:hypothetical protein
MSKSALRDQDLRNQFNVPLRSLSMKRSVIGQLLCILATPFAFGCASEPAAHDENARIKAQTKVTKDQIPAEDQRKIPVTEQY